MASVLVLLLAASGCSWFGGDEEAPVRRAAPAPVEQPELDVEVIGGGADQVEVGDGVTAPEVGSGVYFVSDLYDLRGPRLEEPVLVRMVLQSALPEGTPVGVAVRESDDAPWDFLEGRLDADRRHAEFIVDELGSFGVLAIDTDTLTSGLGEGIAAATATDATTPDGVEAAGCTGADVAADDGYTAESWEVQTVGWCLDSVNDERVLRLTNLRGVPVRVTAPGATDRGTAGDAAREGVDWDAWLGALAPATSGADGVDTFVAPGQTLAVDADLESGSSLLVTVADDARAQAVQTLHAAAVALAAQVAELGVVRRADLPDAETVLATWLETPSCSEAIGRRPAALAEGCLAEDPLTAALGPAARLLAPALVDGVGTRLLRTQLQALTGAGAAVEQRLEVTREAADFGSLVGRFTGTGRSLVVTADGRATESYGTAAGAVMVVSYRLTDPETSAQQGSATATVTDVQVLDRAAARGRAPRVGQAGVLTRRADGTVAAPFGSASYCTAAARRRCVDAPAASPSPTPTAQPRTAGAVVTPADPAPATTTAPTGP